MMLKNFHLGLLLSCLILFANNSAYSAQFFSHAVLNLPFEAETPKAWKLVIKTQDEWEAFYTSLLPAGLPQPSEIRAVPVIDFNNYMVIAGGLGFRPSGGYSLIMDRVIESGDTIYVNAVEVSPGNRCGVLTVITHPTTAILIPKSNKKIQIYLGSAFTSCQ